MLNVAKKILTRELENLKYDEDGVAVDDYNFGAETGLIFAIETINRLIFLDEAKFRKK